MNNSKYLLIILISLNTYFLLIFNISTFDIILNIMIYYGVFNHYKEYNFLLDKDINKAQIFLSFCLLIVILYRSYWLHVGDNFIYLFFPFLLLSFSLISNNINTITLNIRPILISLIFPISKILFIPLSIIITPFSTLFTWIVLNTFSFSSVMNGQEIIYTPPGVDVTFSCSGSGQILFCSSAMIILNIYFPLKSKRLILIQLLSAFLFTFSANILRLVILTIYSYTFDSVGFSIFRYLHGGTGGLFFSFFSMLLSCESYKRLYLRNLKL